MQTNFAIAQERHDFAAPSDEDDTVARRTEELVLQFERDGYTDAFYACDVSEYMHDQWPEEAAEAMAKIARGDYDKGLAEYEAVLLKAVEAMANDAALEERP